MAGRLEGKVTVITGAGSGIGRACACRFAAEGATVVVNDIDPESAAATVRMITDAGGWAFARPGDVTSAQEVERIVQEAASAHGRLDVMFNNAGGSLPTPTLEVGVDEWRRIVALNLDAVFYGVHAALPIMLAQGAGTILSTSSGAGLNAVPGLAAYGAAKAGLIMLMRNIAIEYGGQGIRANAIAPGPMDTPGLRGWLETIPGGYERYRQRVPVGRLGTGDDIAAAAVFLASDEASYINGTVLPVDGAVHARLGAPHPD